MNKCFKILLTIILLIPFAGAIAQNSSADSLTRAGIQLSNQKKYSEAIEKYKAALNIDPENTRANYQLAFTLFASGKGTEGIPYLEKVVKANTAFTAGAYDLLGSIYSGANQLQKAINAYQEGIKTDSTNQRVYYNLGIVYYRDKQYNNAEQSFISAIKRDSLDASSQRMYALSTFHQNKRAEALLGFCRFLTLEPNTSRSAEAFGNLQNILRGASLKAEPGYKPTPLMEAYAASQNAILTKALAGFSTRRYASPTALLTAQLKAVFTALGTMPCDKHYYWHTLADYFYKLSQTNNLPAFTRLISVSVYKDENNK